MNSSSDTPKKDLDYGLFGGKDKDEPSAFRQFIARATEVLSDAVGNAATLTVRTYTTESLKLTADGIPENPQLRAMTKIALDGDTDVYVPTQDGLVDEKLWNLHLETVRVAQAHRTELFRSAMALIRGE